MARLTEQEQQEILRFLEADKPLPEKYRFLLFDDKREVELVWNGKSNEVSNIVLPFQTIEQVDEPRAEKDTKLQTSFFDFDERGRQLKGWTNKLIWGDNKLILSSLKNGPLRDEIEKQGGIKLIYIDPPFDVGADFSMDIEIGDETFTKKPSIIEEIAYRDTWGKGADSFLAMIYERLIIMRDLLAEDGTIYVHIDYRLVAPMRLILDEIFGASNFVNEIIWKRGNHKKTENMFLISHDNILMYSKSPKYTFNPQYGPYDQEYIDKYYNHTDPDGRRYQLQGMYGKGSGPALYFGDKLISPPKGLHWRWNQEGINEAMEKGIIVFPKGGKGMPRFKDYLDTKQGLPVRTIWDDVYEVNSQALERTDYPTQKPESLLERIIKASSNPGDVVADFFCGSGTTAVVAEKTGRKWIGCDLGKFSIHTSRKRLINTQRAMKEGGKDFRAFEILNLGKYERQFFVGLNTSLREEEKIKQQQKKEAEFVNLILSAYKAEKTDGFKTFQGKKAGRLVAIGPINLPVSRLFVEEVIAECRQKHITKIDILGFEFEMGLFPESLDVAKKKGIDIAPKYIPADVFDKRAIEKNQVSFHDVAYIEVKSHLKKNSVAIELTDFSVFYSQDSVSDVEKNLKNKSSKLVIDKGQIIKISKDAKGIVQREKLTNRWSDWIDYWSVDFNFENKKEIIRIKNEATGQIEDVWTGDYVFENEWQSFRTKEERTLELTSPFHELVNSTQKVAVKVVDIFGNDTMTILEVSTSKGKK